MIRYRRKPTLIDAEQYTKFGKLVNGMCNSTLCYNSGNTKPHVHTIHDNQMVILEIDDWVIMEHDGIHAYPCKPDIFKETYEDIGVII